MSNVYYCYFSKSIRNKKEQLFYLDNLSVKYATYSVQARNFYIRPPPPGKDTDLKPRFEKVNFIGIFFFLKKKREMQRDCEIVMFCQTRGYWAVSS